MSIYYYSDSSRSIPLDLALTIAILNDQVEGIIIIIIEKGTSIKLMCKVPVNHWQCALLYRAKVACSV